MTTSIFDLTDTQAMLRDSLDRFLAAHYAVDQRERLLDDAEREAPLWRAFASQLGLLGAGVPEAFGGLGGHLGDQLVVMETLGAHLAAETYLSSAVLAGQLLQRAGGAPPRALMERMVSGDAIVAVATTEPDSRHDAFHVRTRLERHADGGLRLRGRKAVVHCAPWATDLLVLARSAGADDDRAGLSLVRIAPDSPGLRRRDMRTADSGRASELAFDDVQVPADAFVGAEGQAWALLEPALDAATLAVCAEACGVLGRLLADTTHYVRERRQFGVPISSFQVLQHRLADMLMALEQAGAVTAWAAERFDAAPAERARAVSSAKVTVGRACRTVGQGAVQLHGGMGMTEELAVGHFFRRATQIEQLFGPAAHHLRRVDALLA